MHLDGIGWDTLVPNVTPTAYNRQVWTYNEPTTINAIEPSFSQFDRGFLLMTLTNFEKLLRSIGPHIAEPKTK